MNWKNAEHCSEVLAELAVTALIEEVELTPKPGLVDQQNSGAHTDLDVGLMIRSAKSLYQTFYNIAHVSFQKRPSQALRENVAEIGRHGETAMFEATGGVNTHKGAIWALGLLTASAAMNNPETSSADIADDAGKLARYTDRYVPKQLTNGITVQQRYGVKGAREEAQEGFPSIRNIALPVLDKARLEGISEDFARLNVLTALIAHVDDTCILHRGGIEALNGAKKKANEVLAAGGVSTEKGWKALQQLDAELLARNASPGGSADLLAGTLFLDGLKHGNVNWKKENKEIIYAG